MKKLATLIAKIITLLGLPVTAVILHRSSRVRVVIISGDEILLVRSYIGHQKWSLPGGGIHTNEPAPMAAARELHEETGLNLPSEQFKLIGEGRLNAGFPGAYADAQYFSLELSQPSKPVIRRPLEVIEAAWWPIKKLPKRVSATVLYGLELRDKHKRIDKK
jgi:ADP-ribose pyrophosphatase YjhB (NUDIX family)